MSLKAESAILGGRLALYTDQVSADPASIAAGASGNIVWTITGLAIDDEIAGWSTKTSLAGLSVNNIDITANTITISAFNNTAGAVDLGAVTANFLILKDPATAAS